MESKAHQARIEHTLPANNSSINEPAKNDQKIVAKELKIIHN